MIERSFENKDQKINSQNQIWLIGCGLATIVAIFVRFYDLTLRPLHHDEGVNGYFLIKLFRDGIYQYDPSNYHGPTLYYITLAFTKVFGLETVPVRTSVAVFGVLMVLMVLFLRKYLGTIGSLVAAFFLALSPGMVYISRYFIHEIFFVFCSLGIVLGVLFFIEGRKVGIGAVSAMTLLLLVCFFPPVMHIENIIGSQNTIFLWVARISILLIETALVFLLMRILLSWNEGKPIYLLLASASTALFFATKETAFITLGTMIIALFCIWIWRKIYSGIFSETEENELEPVSLSWENFLKQCHESNPGLLLIIVVVVFAYVGVLFFSSFFTYWAGVPAAFEAYAFWTKTGGTDHTQNGYLAYANWLRKVELPILILSLIGTLIAFIKGRHIFAMFVGLWAFGLFAAYTIIPYKTPWLALSFVLPMCLIAGYGINEIANFKDWTFKGLAGLIVLVSISFLGYLTYSLNFERYDDENMPYVYAHTRRGFLNMVEKIEYYAKKSGKGEKATIEIISPDYWSLPWYLRNYPNANFHGKPIDANASELIVAKEGEQDSDIAQRYSTHYKRVGEYPLRPGVDLILLVRRDLADSNTEDIYPELEEMPTVEVSPEPMKRQFPQK